jgi:hypothetical protein
LLKKFSQSFDRLRTNGKRVEMIERIPFMLMRFPKHEYFFFQKPARCRLCPFLALPPTQSMFSAKERPASSDTARGMQTKNFNDD